MSFLGFVIFAVLLAGGCFGSWQAAMYWANRNREARDEDPRDQEIRELSAALSVARKQVADLGNTSGTQNSELTTLQDNLRKVTSVLADLREKYAATKDTLDKEIDERELHVREIGKLQGELDDSKARIAELEVRVPEDAPNSGMVAGFDDMVDDDEKDSLQIRQEHSILKKQTEHYQEKLEAEREESARWKKHCTVMTKTNKTLRSRVDEMVEGQKELEQLRVAHTDLINVNKATEASLSEAHNLISELNTKVDGLDQELSELRPAIAQLEEDNKQIQPLRDDVAQRQARIDELLPVLQEREQLLTQVEALRNIESENQELLLQVKEMRSENAAKQAELQKTNEELQTRVSALDAIQAENQQLAAQVTELRPVSADNERLRADIEAQQKSNHALEAKTGRLERDLEDMALLKAQVAELELEQEENQRLRNSNSELQRAASALKQQSDTQEQQIITLQEADHQRQKLQIELETLAANHADQKRQQAESAELLQLTEAENSELQKQIDSLSEQRQEAEQQRASLEEQLTHEQVEREALSRRMNELETELDDSRASAAQKQADIEDKLQLEQLETSELQARIHKLTEQLADRPAAAEPQSVDVDAAKAFDGIDKPQQQPAAEACSDNTDRLPVLTEAEAQIENDNLQLIKGVGAKLEEKLNSLGIASFRKLLELNDDDYEQAQETIPGLKSRIDRDGWLDQARQLHQEKYSENI